MDLALGRSHACALDPELREVFRVPVAAHTYVELDLQAPEVEVDVQVVPPESASTLAVQRRAPPYGRQRFGFVAETRGEARITVEARAASQGECRLSVAGVPAGQRERRRAAAFGAGVQAEQLTRSEKRADFEQAAQAYARVAREWSALGEPAEAAFAWRRVGQIALDLSDPEVAEEPLDRARALSRAAGDSDGEAQALAVLALRARRAGAEEAPALAREAVEFAQAAGAALAEADALANRGALAHTAGLHDTALLLFRQARDISERRGDARATANALYDEGRSYTLLGRLDDAWIRFDQAFELFRQAGAVRGQGRTLAQIGWLQHVAGDDRGALMRYDTALSLLASTGVEAELPGVRDRYGTSLFELGQARDALDMFNMVQEYYRRRGDRGAEVRVQANVARAQAQLGQRGLALQGLDETVAVLRAAHADDTAADVLRARAELRRDVGDLDGALDDAREALAILERLRGDASLGASRANYLSARHEFTSLTVDLLMRLDEQRPGQGYAERAFEAAEAGRGRALLDTLTHGRTTVPSAALRRELEAMSRRIDQADARVRELRARRATEARVMDAERSLRSLVIEREEVERRSPLPTAAPLRLADIRRALPADDDTLLLTYSLGEERSYAWLVGRSLFEPRVLRIGERAAEEAARGLRDGLAAARAEWEWTPVLLAATALAESVLDPFRGLLGKRRLVIAGDGALRYVPFAVLPVEPEDPASALGLPSGWPDGRVPLLLEHELVSIPSASVLVALRGREARRPAPRGLLAVVSDPVFERTDTRLPAVAPVVGGSGPDSRRRDSSDPLDASILAAGDTPFRRLLHTADEAERILALLPPGEGLRIEGVDATREQVLGSRLGDANILHFATHGLLNPNPELSGLVLSRWDAEGRPRRGFLRAHELAGLRLAARLVVLSACRTARLSRDVRGEGLTGLPQAFMQAGAARVVVSLWNVDDEATAVLMEQFHRRVIGEHLAPAAALRAAQLELLRDERFGAPGLWAAFLLEGDWSAITRPRANN